MMTAKLRDLDRFLAHAERTIALLERCRPLNAASERRRLLDAWRRGRAERPRWVHRPVPELGGLLDTLEAVAERAGRAGPWGRLYAARAEELRAEGRIVQALGRDDFMRRAGERFPCDGSSRADAWSEARCRSPHPAPEAPLCPSDDERNPQSLVYALREAVGALRLPIRVELSAELLSAAAAGEGVIRVRTGARHTPDAVRRIVLHEIHGHVLPRLRAREERLGLFAVGTRNGSDDEEGRALILEARAGLMGEPRKQELARRHLAARAVREGADWVETVRLVLSWGADLETALAMAQRAHRGGGLGRELVYLPAYFRVERALAEEPELEGWLERGRIGVEAARLIREIGEPPEQIDARSAA